jgi:hypothetical protein
MSGKGTMNALLGKKARRRLEREQRAKERDAVGGRHADDAIVAHLRDVRTRLPGEYHRLREKAEADAATGVGAAIDVLVLFDRAESPCLYLAASLP